MMVHSHSEDICSEIEQVRQQMNVLGCSHGLLHPEVMKCSQQLDKLLIQHYAMEKRRRHKN
ncbi:aspartyl-phosphate phosphatase Spo0E family protein [Paenibacillus sp. MBLB4367]|uniref:aspartyl-phosphate phosphatase Spo0E family protein n=1 Tax=Paenibacillus sp. MBLB4367 TaxID=3384767 RepID=UPI0039083A36